MLESLLNKVAGLGFLPSYNLIRTRFFFRTPPLTASGMPSTIAVRKYIHREKVCGEIVVKAGKVFVSP